MYYILLLAALVTAAWSQSLFAWGLLFGLAILAAYGWISTSSIVGQLQVELHLPDGHLFTGEQSEARLVVANTTRLPLLWLYLRQDLPPNLVAEGDLEGSRVIGLAGLETRQFVCRFGSLKRGIYSFGPLVLETGDLLGLFRQRIERPHGRSIIVYPHIHDVSRLRTPSRLPFGSPRSPRMLTEDPSWVKGIRDYSTGDPLNRIHWRATAHAGRLQTRELEPAVTLDSVVVLNLDRDTYPARYADALAELAIEVSASIIVELLARRCACQLRVNLAGQPPIAGKGPLDIPRYLRAMAALDAGDGWSICDAAKAGAGAVGLGGIVYIVTPHIDDRLVAAAYALSGLGRSPVLVHICPRDRVPSRMAELNRGPLQYIRAQRGLAAQSLELISPQRGAESL